MIQPKKSLTIAQQFIIYLTYIAKFVLTFLGIRALVSSSMTSIAGMANLNSHLSL